MIPVTVTDYSVLLFWKELDQEITRKSPHEALATAGEVRAIFPDYSGNPEDIWKSYDQLKAGRTVEKVQDGQLHSGGREP